MAQTCKYAAATKLEQLLVGVSLNSSGLASVGAARLISGLALLAAGPFAIMQELLGVNTNTGASAASSEGDKSREEGPLGEKALKAGLEQLASHYPPAPELWAVTDAEAVLNMVKLGRQLHGRLDTPRRHPGRFIA